MKSKKSKEEPTLKLFVFCVFIESFLTEYAEILQKKISDNHQGFFVRRYEASSLAGKTVLRFHCWVLFPLLSLVFKNKDDFLYAQGVFCFVLST